MRLHLEVVVLVAVTSLAVFTRLQPLLLSSRVII